MTILLYVLVLGLGALLACAYLTYHDSSIAKETLDLVKALKSSVHNLKGTIEITSKYYLELKSSVKSLEEELQINRKIIDKNRDSIHRIIENYAYDASDTNKRIRSIRQKINKGIVKLDKKDKK